MAALVTPLFAKAFFDSAVVAADAALVDQLIIGTVVATFLAATLQVLRAFHGQIIMGHTNHALASLYTAKVLYAPLAARQRFSTGELIARQADLHRALASVATLFRTAVLNAGYVILIPPLLFALEWRLALAGLASVPFIWVGARVAGHATRRWTRAAAERSAKVQTAQIDAVECAVLIKVHSAESQVLCKLDRLRLAALGAHLRVGGIGAAYGAGNAVARVLGTALYLSIGWHGILEGRMTIGTFVAFSAYLGMLLGPLTQAASMIVEAQQTGVLLARTFDVLDQPSEQAMQYATPQRASRLAPGPTITFDSVTFGYNDGPLVLSGFNASFTGGAVTAITGANGAGKSTILSLLQRLYDPSAGHIRLDASEIGAMPLPDLRTRVGVVGQGRGLMSGTIRENLLLGSEPVEEQELADVLATVNLTEAVAALPEGLDTELHGEEGVLSAGQRQRIQIARALLRNPSVLAMDESTSHVDQAGRLSLLEGVRRRLPSATILLVTHDPAVIAYADHVVTMSQSERHTSRFHQLSAV